VVGSRDDYDEWARLVGDEDFNWKNAKRCLDKVTRLHPEMPDPEIKQYLRVKSEGKVDESRYTSRCAMLTPAQITVPRA
jgi:hypothetical protein